MDEDVKGLIVSHLFNVGNIINVDSTLRETMASEQTYKWKGRVGLINVSDYLKANIDSEKCGTISLNMVFSDSVVACSNSNWMYLAFSSDNF